MDIVTLTKENLETEHICCALSNNNDIQVFSKKSWLQERFEDGLVFKKGNVRGKCFIEYIPSEKAWVPIDAKGYMYINCLWVSGKFKGQGYSNLFLDECIKDSKEKGKKGLVILSSKKKLPFLADPKFLLHKGFLASDEASPSFVLMYLPFSNDTETPKFKAHVKTPTINEKGFVLYYTHQCPFTAKYVPLIEKIALTKGVPFKSIKLETTKQAQEAPSPCTSYSMFYNGNFLTNEILSENKFEKLIDSI